MPVMVPGLRMRRSGHSRSEQDRNDQQQAFSSFCSLGSDAYSSRCRLPTYGLVGLRRLSRRSRF